MHFRFFDRILGHFGFGGIDRLQYTAFAANGFRVSAPARRVIARRDACKVHVDREPRVLFRKTSSVAYRATRWPIGCLPQKGGLDHTRFRPRSARQVKPLPLVGRGWGGDLFGGHSRLRLMRERRRLLPRNQAFKRYAQVDDIHPSRLCDEAKSTPSVILALGAGIQRPDVRRVKRLSHRADAR